MSDEELYLEATKEVESENKNQALWAKVMALSEGDQNKAKYQYINLRVNQLLEETRNKEPTFTKKTVDQFDIKYMPIAEFSRIKEIPEKKVIEMIRDGFYVGQIRNEEWYVSREEVGNTEVPKPESRKSQNSGDPKKEYIPVEEFAGFKGITSEKAIAMIRDGFYEGQIIDNKWYVAYSEVSNESTSVSSESDGFFSKLISGDYGLPKTYWLFGVLGNLMFIVPIALAAATKSMPILVLALLASVVYSLIVAVGIWRAADKYLGQKVWAVLAKIAVILGILRLLIDLISLGNIKLVV